MSDNNNLGDIDVNINVTELSNEVHEVHEAEMPVIETLVCENEPEDIDDLQESQEPDDDQDQPLENIEININSQTGYNYDIVLTYKMIDDDDDQDTLFRLQFLQAFGITSNEYQPDIVSAELDLLYSRFRDNSTIQKILQSHPLYNKEIRGSNASTADDNTENTENTDGSAIVMSTDNGEMIFCMMFSFQTFDLFHKCLQDAHYGREISSEIIEQLTVFHKNMF